MLFEIRFSPQLHRWVYGFFPHDFSQQFRDGGYRPVVFLNHGLAVALFAAMAVIAAAIVYRAKWHILRLPAAAVTSYLAVLLLLCKTMGATVYAIVAAPLALFTTPRAWVRLACAILLLVCAYPLLRTYDVVPVHHIAAAAKTISIDRSASFQTRVKNEDMLLSKANEKPLFGWLGYLSLFGLLATAALRARAAVRGPVTQASVVIGGLSLLLAVNVVDLLPNSNIFPFTFLLAGSIAGCVRVRTAERSVRRNEVGSRTALATR
jgi:hypothetical protein